MSILGIQYQSIASRKCADYILSMGDQAPEYMNEVGSSIRNYFPKLNKVFIKDTT